MNHICNEYADDKAAFYLVTQDGFVAHCEFDKMSIMCRDMRRAIKFKSIADAEQFVKNNLQYYDWHTIMKEVNNN